MSTPLAVAVFLLGSAVSLGTSWLLVSRIERIGARLSASEAMLGLIAALAANTPEISSAFSALAHHQQAIGAGVVIGSNVFNLAALLGLGAVVAGHIALHRRVVLLAGGVAVWVAAVCLLTAVGAVPPVAGLLAVLAVLVPYVVLAALEGPRVRNHGLAMKVRRWLRIAIYEEELELSTAIHPRRGHTADAIVAVVALGVVITASVAMERSASTLGARWGVSDIIVGGVVLAAVTSLPNAVAAIYLARRGRGAAMLSTALNSNALNVAVGFLLPAAVLGIGRISGHVVLVSAWYVGLTLVALAFAYLDTGLRRDAGCVILVSYLAFFGVLVATSRDLSNLALLLVPPIVIASTVCVLLLRPGRNPAKGRRP
jgi:cation:H+ antiporter